MRKILWLVLLIMAIANNCLATDLAADKSEQLKKSVVRIVTHSQRPDFVVPWRMKDVKKTAGTGFVIENNLIMTNAHVVDNAKYILVNKYANAKQYEARIDKISHYADLAVLIVDDPEFYQDTVPMSFGDLPQTPSNVDVYGYPTEGYNLCITRGVLSRIENRSYAHSKIGLLTGQVDAAINPGNSGGPVIHDGKAIGVAMQVTRGEKIEGYGFIIPFPVIKQFLVDISDGKYDGIPYLGLWEGSVLTNETMQKYFHAENNMGIVINKVGIKGSMSNLVLRDDVVLSINNYQIENNGNVEIMTNVFVDFDNATCFMQIGDKVIIKVLRDGQEIDIPVPLNQAYGDGWIAKWLFDQRPRYFVYGGIVFMPFSLDYYFQYREELKAEPGNLLKWISEAKENDRDEIVVLSRVLMSKLTRGYDINNRVVKSVNGKKPLNFKDFVNIILESKEKYIVIEFDDDSLSRIVINRQEAQKQGQEIMEQYNIPTDRFMN